MKYIVFTRRKTEEDGGVYTYILGLLELLDGHYNFIVFDRRNSFNYWIELFRSFNKKKIISIHNIWSLVGLLTLILSKFTGNSKIFLHPHGMMEPWCLQQKKIKKEIFITLLGYFSRSDNITLIATSNLELNNLKRLFNRTNIVKVTPFVKSKFVGPFGESNNRNWLNIVYFGRFHEKKGLNLLIQAMHELGDSIPLTFNLYGFGDNLYIEKIKNDAFGLKNFFFHGYLSYDDKWEVLKKCGALVLPSYSENFGYVVPEALSQGCHIITTLETPWPYELSDENCTVIKKLDVYSIKVALEQYYGLIKSAENLFKLEEKSKKHYSDNYSDNVAKNNYINKFTYD
jgi:glycosyltransferase involved in cell wall biosynthesis